jgi:hypothetical protein
VSHHVKDGTWIDSAFRCPQWDKSNLVGLLGQEDDGIEIFVWIIIVYWGGDDTRDNAPNDGGRMVAGMLASILNDTLETRCIGLDLLYQFLWGQTSL